MSLFKGFDDLVDPTDNCRSVCSMNFKASVKEKPMDKRLANESKKPAWTATDHFLAKFEFFGSLWCNQLAVNGCREPILPFTPIIRI